MMHEDLIGWSFFFFFFFFFFAVAAFEKTPSLHLRRLHHTEKVDYIWRTQSMQSVKRSFDSLSVINEMRLLLGNLDPRLNPLSRGNVSMDFDQ